MKWGGVGTKTVGAGAGALPNRAGSRSWRRRCRRDGSDCPWIVPISACKRTFAIQSATVARSSEILNRTRDSLREDPEAARIYLMALSGEHIKDTLNATWARLLLIALTRDYEAIYYQQIAG